MKLCHVWKKLFSYIVLFGLLVVPSILFAQTAAELNAQIGQRNQDIAKLEQEIRVYQSELNSLSKQKSSLNTSIKQLDLTRKKLEADIAVTKKKIENATSKIKNLSSQIGVKENLIASDVSAIKAGLESMNEVDNNSFLESFLSEGSFSAIWNDTDNIIAVREKVREKIVELKQVKGQLEDTRKTTMDARHELLGLQSELSDQKKIVDQNTAAKKKLLAQTKNSETSYQKLLKDRQAKKDAFEKELLAYESKLKFILDPSSLPKSHVLDWPLGNVYITGFFSKNANRNLYANGFHNGVDFRASVGTPILAMADGTVAGTGDTDLVCDNASFGKFVFIKYSNGLASTYGHLSLIKVSAGQKVSRGEVVGYSGNTGYSTGPHLHLSVYVASAVSMQSRPSQACGGRTYTMPISPIGAYLDPMTYLPLYKS